MPRTRRPKAQIRSQDFAERIATRIWQEEPDPENPYLALRCRCQGYDLFDLMRECRFLDVLLLLFTGELPTKEQARLLELLMIALINPGPRHPASRAAMNAGAGRTDPAHILPISMSVLSGSHLGAHEVEMAMRFLRRHLRRQPGQTAERLIGESQRPLKGDWHIAPGFGSRYGGIDPIPRHLASTLVEQPGHGPALRWGAAFAEALVSESMGWLSTGVAAAVFLDLGCRPPAGAGLFQLLSAPGLLAHGIEMAGRPTTSLPFPRGKHYVIEES
jgi:citrate synthase